MKVLLADDHDLVRDAICSLLQKDAPEMEIKAVKNFNEAFSAMREAQDYEIVILDLKMPGMNGLSGMRKMIELAPDIPVIIMSGSARVSDIQSALSIGAKGFVPKTLAGRSLLNAMRLVASGEIYVPVSFMAGTPQAKASEKGADNPLSPREAQVLSQLRCGNSNKEISRTLDIAETTVKLHIRSLSDKLSARNRTDIVVKAIDAGMA